MTTSLKAALLSKIVLASFVLFFTSATLKAQTVTINNGTGCAYDVTLVGANWISTLNCTSICWASETTVTVMPGTTTVTLTGCANIAPVRATVEQTGCVSSPSALVEVPFCSCSGGASTDSDSFVVPPTCCDPGATVTVDASCGVGTMTVDIY